MEGEAPKEAQFLPLILSSSEEENETYKKLVKGKDSLKELIKTTVRGNYDKFQEGTRKDNFNAVIIALLGDEISGDDIEMQEEFYQYYGVAPVTAWVFRDDIGDGFGSLISEGHKVFKYAGTEDDAKVKALADALGWAKAEHAAKRNDDVKKAFTKFDTDGSGNIDKDELTNLSKELGFELSEEQQETAL